MPPLRQGVSMHALANWQPSPKNASEQEQVTLLTLVGMSKQFPPFRHGELEGVAQVLTPHVSNVGLGVIRDVCVAMVCVEINKYKLKHN